MGNLVIEWESAPARGKGSQSMGSEIERDEVSSSGEIGRRKFLGLGIAAVGGAVLAACGSGSSSSTTTAAAAAGTTTTGAPARQTGPIVLAGPQDNSGTITILINQWNNANPDTPVSFQTIPPTTNDVYNQYVTALAGGASTPDVLTMDVTYPGTFAAAGWVLPLDQYASSSFQSGFIPTALDIGKYKGKLYAIPQSIDVGQLYYRTDLLTKYNEKVPTTYAELVRIAEKVQAGERASNPNFWGYVWEGAQIEAIFDEFCEYTWGYGGEISSGSKVTLDTAAGNKSLQFLYDCIYTTKISPPGTSTMKPNDALVLMQNGNALFMRNWTYAYTLANSPTQSKVPGMVSNATLPGLTDGSGHGCTGGWMYGINAKSTRPEAAWRVVQYLTSQAQQIQLTAGAGLLSARKDVQANTELLVKSPNLKNLPTILASAKARPSIQNYPAVSTTLQAPLNSVIAKQSSVSAGLSAMQAAVGSAVVA